MTEQERKDAFLASVAALEKQYGITIISTVAAKQYGGMLQIEPGQPQMVVIADWKPPEPPAA